MKVLAQVKAFLKDEQGASGIEYAIIAAMVAVVIAGFAGTGTDSIGTKVSGIFTSLKNGLNTQSSGG